MKIKTAALVVLISLSLMNCGYNDNGGGDSPSTVDFTFEGQGYSFNSGYSVDGVEPNFGYYYTDFVIGTDSFMLNESILPTIAVQDFQMTTAILYVNLMNEGDTFETGTYVFSNTEVPKYFEFGYIRLPGNDNEFNLGDDYLFFDAGSVTVTGGPANYSLAFDVTLSNGQNVNFTYTSNLVYLDAF